MSKTLKAHPLVGFYILTFVLAWCIKIPVVVSHTRDVLLRLLPSLFPAIAAFAVATVIGGRRAVENLLAQASKLRVSPAWYAIALAGPLALNLLALILAMPFGTGFPKPDFAGIRVLPVILLATFFALGEEIGWRGFALPRLQERFSPLAASLIVGTLWWAWHLPEALSGPGAGLSVPQISGLKLQDLVLDLASQSS